MKLKIKEARKAAGMKQEDLAKALGVSASYISQMERGKPPSTYKILKKSVGR